MQKGRGGVKEGREARCEEERVEDRGVTPVYRLFTHTPLPPSSHLLSCTSFPPSFSYTRLPIPCARSHPLPLHTSSPAQASLPSSLTPAYPILVHVHTPSLLTPPSCTCFPLPATPLTPGCLNPCAERFRVAMVRSEGKRVVRAAETARRPTVGFASFLHGKPEQNLSSGPIRTTRGFVRVRHPNSAVATAEFRV